MSNQNQTAAYVPASVQLRAAKANGWLEAARVAKALDYLESIWVVAMRAHHGGDLSSGRPARINHAKARASCLFDEYVERLELEERRGCVGFNHFHCNEQSKEWWALNGG